MLRLAYGDVKARLDQIERVGKMLKAGVCTPQEAIIYLNACCGPIGKVVSDHSGRRRGGDDGRDADVVERDGGPP